MWNQFLHEAKSERKFHNTPLIVLGRKHSGKRSLLDSLFDVSKTTLHSKRLSNTYLTSKMKLKGLAPILDYAYLNVLDLNDPDYRTHAKLEIYMIEDPKNVSAYKQLQNAQILKKAVVLIMLDFTAPWDFMQQLNTWVRFIQELQMKAGLTITDLEQMASRTQKCYTSFKEVQFDENGQLKKNFIPNEEEQIDVPLIEGVLTNNLRIPITVCVNKSDLQLSVFRDQSANKLQFVLYHLRQFCLNYGASLIYTSIKNNSNLNILYEYILHQSYTMSLRFKSEVINEEAIFVPLGFDSPTLLQDSVMKMDVTKAYSEVIVAPVTKKNVKEQITVEEESQFFKKYIGGSIASESTLTVADNDSSVSSTTKSKGTEATTFFMKLLSNNSVIGGPEQQEKTTQAQNSLLKHTTKQMNLSRQIKAKQ